MKVLSIREPWASLIVNVYKEYEFRTWRTNYRGKILIHASKNLEKDNIVRFKEIDLVYNPGFIIGEAELVDCIPVTKKFEDDLIRENELVYGASKGRGGYAWKLKNIRRINPIEAKGKLGLWNYDF